ncbi:PAS domain S-box protein [Paenibacillus sp. CC-CFT747]|nr:PAS domain S-box protein [Paenibacillus sp. CC-CFT747]
MTGKQAGTIAAGREEMFRIIAEHTSDTIVVVDSEAIVRYVSPSIYTQSGYTAEEYEGTDAFAIIVPEDRELVRLSLAQAVQARTPIDVGYRVQHADGRILEAETKVMPVLADGSVNYVVAVVRDVTARKQAERLLENILDNVNAAVWSTDKDFSRFMFFSESGEKITGLPREEVIQNPMRMHDHIHPDDNELLVNEVKGKLSQGLPVRQEFRWTHHPEGQRWGQSIVHPHLNNKGEVERLDGIMLDITDKKRAELALEESEQRYKSLFEYNLDGVFSIVLEGLYFEHANAAFERITGIRRETMENQCFIGMIFDEDHGMVYETLFEVMREGRPRDIECRLADLSKGERIVSITFVPILLSGKLNGIHGILKDITKRKQEERELTRSEERSNFLQSSLNQLSSDLAGVMKVAELEAKLIDEVRVVLKVQEVRIEETFDIALPLDSDEHTIRIRIGEKPQPVWLSIGLDRPLPELEKKWLQTAVRYVTILYDNLYRTEDLMKRMEETVAGSETPRWMLRLLFKLSEKERASLSSDLHDSVLQDLIIWYRKLESLRSSNVFEAVLGAQLSGIEEGLLDAIHQIPNHVQRAKTSFSGENGAG